MDEDSGDFVGADDFDFCDGVVQGFPVVRYDDLIAALDVLDVAQEIFAAPAAVSAEDGVGGRAARVLSVNMISDDIPLWAEMTQWVLAPPTGSDVPCRWSAPSSKDCVPW